MSLATFTRLTRYHWPIIYCLTRSCAHLNSVSVTRRLAFCNVSISVLEEHSRPICSSSRAFKIKDRGSASRPEITRYPLGGHFILLQGVEAVASRESLRKNRHHSNHAQKKASSIVEHADNVVSLGNLEEEQSIRYGVWGEGGGRGGGRGRAAPETSLS